MFPYDEYSWPLTQHLGKVGDPQILYELLKSAHLFRHDIDRDKNINSRLNNLGIFPKNVRADSKKSDIWRDYQQVLPEIGLMESTRYSKIPTLTNTGLLWLDKEFIFRDLITNQSLKYQYPNGFKLQFPKGINSDNFIRNRASLDASHNILIKPGVLILRVLLEIFKDDNFIIKDLSAVEVVAALMPLQKNSEWSEALCRLKFFRESNVDTIPNLNSRKRHVQEWFRFLSYGYIFELRDNRISLNENFLLQDLENLCKENESIESYWIPADFSEAQDLHLSWFEYYGNFNPSMTWIESKDEPHSHEDIDYKINLSEFKALDKKFKHNSTGIKRSNYEKYKESSLLHEEMISEMNTHISNKGFKVFEDHNSIDLLGISSEKEIMFEVKAIGNQDFTTRIRLGVGQALEYRHRYAKDVGKTPETYLLVNGNFEVPSWYNGYFENDLKIGLIQRKSNNKFTIACDPFNNSEIFEL